MRNVWSMQALWIIFLAVGCSFSVERPNFPGGDAEDSAMADGSGGDVAGQDQASDPGSTPDGLVDLGPDGAGVDSIDIAGDTGAGETTPQECQNHSDCSDLDDCTLDQCVGGECVHEKIPGCGDCLGEGKEFEDPNPEGKCCAPLTAVPVSTELGVPCVDEFCWPDYDCQEPNCPCWICTQCGDGVCGVGENRCNCNIDCEKPFPCKDVGGYCTPEPVCPDGTPGIYPADCGPEMFCCPPGGECAGPGQAQGVGPEMLPCCNGLASIPMMDWSPDGECLAIPGGNICSNCGDMMCDPWENPCNCQYDCGDGECVLEGQMFEGIYEFSPCCNDLEPITYAEVSETGDCMFVNCLCFVCANCGNGMCGPGENYCNCPEDCGEQPPQDLCTASGGTCYPSDSPCPPGSLAEPFSCPEPDSQQCCMPMGQECVGEGKKVPVIPDAPPCCEDLVLISTAFPKGEICEQPVGSMLCSRCGDEVCQSGWENVCNCPEDCPLSTACSKIGPPCPNGQYCQLPTGKCIDSTVPGSCVTIPKFCPGIYAPVCGCDGNTYGNQCEMESAGVSKKHDGECKAECFLEGTGFVDFDTSGKCCAGLSVIEACAPSEDGKGCVCEPGASHMCAFCGNGKCGLGESWCNCPKDCLPPAGTTCQSAKGECVPLDPLPKCSQGYFPLPLPGCNLPVDAGCCLPK